MAARKPHGVMNPTSSASISVHIESKSSSPPEFSDMLDFLSLESIDLRFALEKLHLE